MILNFVKKNPSIAINIFTVFIERLIQLVLTVASFGMLAKAISLTDNGRYFFAFNLSAIFLTITFYAGAELVVPRLSKYNYLKKHIISTGMYLRIFYGLLCFIVSLIYTIFFIHDTEIAWVFMIFIIGPLFSEVCVIFACWFTASGRNLYFSIIRTIGLLGRFFAFWAFSKIDNVSIVYFAFPYMIEAIIIGILTILAYKNHKQNPGFGKFYWDIAKPMFKKGIIIGLGLTFNYVFLKLDRIILQSLVDYKSLGSYSAIMQINEAWFNVGVTICNVLAPYFIFTKAKAGVKRKFYLNAIGLTVFAILFSLIINIFNVQIIHFILGVSYLPSSYLLKISSWFAIFVFLQQLCSMWWLREKKYFFQIFIWIIGICTMGISATLLVPYFALYGMLYSVLIAYIVMIGYQFYVIRKEN